MTLAIGWLHDGGDHRRNRLHDAGDWHPGKEPRSRARARGSPRKVVSSGGEPESSDFKLATACYFECYRAERGEDPVFGSIEGKSMKTLLAKARGGEKACEFIRRAFKSFRRKTATIQQIAKDPGSFNDDAPKRGQSVQHAPVDDPEFASLGRK